MATNLHFQSGKLLFGVLASLAVTTCKPHSEVVGVLPSPAVTARTPCPRWLARD